MVYETIALPLSYVGGGLPIGFPINCSIPKAGRRYFVSDGSAGCSHGASEADWGTSFRDGAPPNSMSGSSSAAMKLKRIRAVAKA